VGFTGLESSLADTIDACRCSRGGTVARRTEASETRVRILEVSDVSEIRAAPVDKAAAEKIPAIRRGHHTRIPRVAAPQLLELRTCLGCDLLARRAYRAQPAIEAAIAAIPDRATDIRADRYTGDSRAADSVPAGRVAFGVVVRPPGAPYECQD